MTLTDGAVIADFPQIKSDLEKVAYVSHLMELITAFSESEYNHKKLFDFIIKILRLVEESKTYIRYIYMFELKYLYLLGLAPNFKQCVVCNNDKNLTFSVKSGGYVCENHLISDEMHFSPKDRSKNWTRNSLFT